MSIRLIACVDFDTNDLDDAYRQLYQAMKATSLMWESSDEWFGDDSELGDEEELGAARMRVLASMDTGDEDGQKPRDVES